MLTMPHPELESDELHRFFIEPAAKHFDLMSAQHNHVDQAHIMYRLSVGVMLC
jgi:hypothetical protein